MFYYSSFFAAIVAFAFIVHLYGNSEKDFSPRGNTYFDFLIIVFIMFPPVLMGVYQGFIDDEKMTAEEKKHIQISADRDGGY